MITKSAIIPHTGSNGRSNGTDGTQPSGIPLASSSFRSKPIDVVDITRLSLSLIVNHSSSGGTPVGPLVTGSVYLQYSNDVAVLFKDSSQKDQLADKVRGWITDESTRFDISGSSITARSTGAISTGGTATASTSYPAVHMFTKTPIHSRWARIGFDNANTAASGSITGSIVLKEY